MYKILKFHWNREESLEGPVFAGEERWESVEEALDDLSLHGWEMQFPLYGPVRANGATGTRLEGFVLVNRATTPLEDLARRISRVESFLAEKRRTLAGLPDQSPEYRSVRTDIDRSEEQLHRLRERLTVYETATPRRTSHGRPLVYGEFREGRMSTEEDFKLAEWRLPEEDVHGR